MTVKYKIYNPSGNITAIIIGDNYTKSDMKRINNCIMREQKSVEQVGFVSDSEKKLTMTGGEFCGNATSCAIKYYLKDEKEKIQIKVSGMYTNVNGGIDKLGNIWLEIPIDRKNEIIQKINEKIYKVNLYGITHIIAQNVIPSRKKAINMINKYKDNNKAIGAIFTKRIGENIKIYPYVLVKNIDTLFLENACGSGTASIGILESYKKKENVTIKIVQPSGGIIKVILKNDSVYLYSKVETDDIIREINI